MQVAMADSLFLSFSNISESIIYIRIYTESSVEVILIEKIVLDWSHFCCSAFRQRPAMEV